MRVVVGRLSILGVGLVTAAARSLIECLGGLGWAADEPPIGCLSNDELDASFHE